MLEDDFNSGSGAEMLRKLFGEVHRTMLSARAAERHHQVLEAAVLVPADACVHKSHDVSKKLVHCFVLDEVVDDRRVFSSESFKSLFAAGIRQPSRIEHEAAAVSAFILRQTLV